MTEPPTAMWSGFLSRLKFPQLFMLAAGLFVFDVFVPDMLPFVDELLLAIGTILLGSLQKKVTPEAKPQIKDVTARGSDESPN